jgi:hypothetical protein
MYCNLILKRAALFIVFSMLLFTACKKKNSNPLNDADDNGGYASDASKIEWLSNDAISIADAGGNYFNGNYMRTTNPFGNCASVSIDSLHTPRLLIIRFGDVNCMCLDGRNRRGTIVVQFDTAYNVANRQHQITFQDYHVNDVKLDGNIIVTRIDTTVVGNWFYNVKSSLSMTSVPNQIVTWQGSLVRKWVDGYATGDRGDNIYSLSGAATLTRANGHIYVFNINTPIQFAENCDYAESGVITVSGYNGARVLNYGAGSNNPVGTCDNDAQLNIAEHVYQIKL